MSNSHTRKMTELMEPIEVQIMMCQTDEEEILLASGMIVAALHLMTKHVGYKGAETLISDVINKAKDL